MRDQQIEYLNSLGWVDRPAREDTVSTGTQPRRVIHLRFDGRSTDIPMDELDVGDGSSDADIKQAVANHLSVPLTKLADYVVDPPAGQRDPEGNLTLRPDATFATQQDWATAVGGALALGEPGVMLDFHQVRARGAHIGPGRELPI